MKIIILILFFLLAATFLVDYLRKKKTRQSSAPAERLPTANEMSPTETGRLRVAHIVEAIKKSTAEKDAEPEAPQPSADIDDPDSELPDPFDGNGGK